MARFKKGSAEAKAWGRKMKRLMNSKKSPTRKRSKSTIRRGSTIKRKRVRTMAKKKRKVSRKKTMTIMGINTGKAASAGVYGAIRQRMSGYLMPYTSKIPVGAISDEIGMVVALQVAKKYLFKGKANFMKDVATTGQAIEFARIGEAFALGQVNLGALSPQQSNGNLF